MEHQLKPFLKFVIAENNRRYFWGAIIVGLVYFVILRLLYPVPSYFADSFTYIGTAVNRQPISFRPVGYSRALMFFKLLSVSDIALIAAQYFSNLLVNLFLFFSFVYFFPLKNILKNVLFVLLIINSFYLFYSNYISPDAFFCSLTVLWFALMLFTLNKPTWYLFIAQLVILVALFNLRYNAVLLPVVMTLVVLLTKQTWWKKFVNIGITYLAIIALVFYTTIKTERYVGTKTFSAFSGWQLANNALHILRFENVDTATLKSRELKEILTNTKNFFDTTKDSIPVRSSSWYQWHPNSPLKKYVDTYAKKKKTYFLTWNALGPIYNKFGKAIIAEKPVGYLKHFVVPNTKEYFYPKLEIYDTYFEDVDTVARIATKFYKYKTNKVSKHKPALYAAVFEPWRYIFPLMNVLLMGLGVSYIAKKKYKAHPVLFNQALLCFVLFFIINFFFIVLLAPSVLRYHIFILTLSFPFVLYLLQGVIELKRVKELFSENAVLKKERSAINATFTFTPQNQ